MKRQGIEGFTFDSKADEWAAWCWGSVEHNPPKTAEDGERMWRMVSAYSFEALDAKANAVCGPIIAKGATEPRHSPAQPQNTVGIGVDSGRVIGLPLWPFWGLGVLALVTALRLMGII